MEKTALKSIYQNRISSYQDTLKQVVKQKAIVGWLRLICFLIIPLWIYMIYPNGQLSVLGTLVLLSLFLGLVTLFTRLKNKYIFIERIIQMNKAEINVIDKNFSDFDNGSEFEDGRHPYAVDMDLFHKNGLFPFLNRTVTLEGKQKLASYLLKGKSDFTNVPQAIEDLKGKLDWRHRYLAGAYLEENKDSDALQSFLNFPQTGDRSIRFFRFLLPLISISALLFWQFEVITDVQFLLILVFPIVVLSFHLKQTNKLLFTASRTNGKWNSMLNRLAMLESEKFTSELLVDLQQKMTSSTTSTTIALRKISKIISLSDYRLNMLMGIVLNIFLAWDFWMRTMYMDWLKKYASEFEFWENDLAELEVWICGANYAYNRSDLTYAVLESKEICIENMGHPVLREEDTVKNDFKADENCSFSIVTGPNMAGKSTFLRGVGVNLILARCGFPVVSSVFKMPNLKLYSSMRTSDDLASSSSYFFAELSRLRFIVDAIERGEKVFIILDEILKGTNSVDKEKGSAEFLQKLNQLQTNGIIATHDLSLCQLATNNSSFQNVFFDSIIENDELSFDYKIRNGVCQNMNASFLLRKMGLT
jgi:hypothetical protein